MDLWDSFTHLHFFRISSLPNFPRVVKSTFRPTQAPLGLEVDHSPKRVTILHSTPRQLKFADDFAIVLAEPTPEAIIADPAAFRARDGDQGMIEVRIGWD